MAPKKFNSSGRSFFNSVVLFDVDLELQAPAWIRSNVLAFFFTWLQRRWDRLQLQGGTTSSQPPPTSEHASSPPSSPTVWFADTSIVQCMTQFGSADLGPVALMESADVLLLPVSNYLDATTINSGHHWSTLRLFVIRQPNSSVHLSFRHLDSMKGCNDWHAQVVEDLFIAFFKQRHSAVTVERSGKSKARDQDDFPQQTNSSDCGLFCCAAAEAYFRHLLYPHPPIGSSCTLPSDPPFSSGHVVVGSGFPFTASDVQGKFRDWLKFLVDQTEEDLNRIPLGESKRQLP
jgi:hypothetical protein